ncbi:META domain-containing protein [Maribacter litopenaei]|uniref:META domain-containing protein n=1 Tax=Maribacter litopenaei TaxID=2976127 RepID=A0ABY5YD18_9FLAO|nr:META domain-containing protein [Maribacter litopenaei]UWX55771.1 META domain-containing protein [Maribacter litopenaei]
MNLTKLLLILFLLVLIQSCSNKMNKVLRVSGIKTECSAGAGKMQCLNIYRGEDINNPNWENFYASIKGFEFEEGYLQKIEVKETRLDKNEVPADGSSIKYELIKVLDKQKDIRSELNGDWTLVKLNNAPLNRMVAIPTITIELSKKVLAANGGCNNFTGQIETLTASEISLGTVAGTKKACINKNVEPEFQKTLNSISTYQIQGETVIFFDKTEKKILEFIKEKPNNPNQRLHDIWVTTRINGNPINRMSPIPRMEINLTDLKVFGYDGCNQYSGGIKKVTENQIVFGNLASTKKMCHKMDTAEAFIKAINQVAFYKLEGLNLILMNEENEEVLAFLKGD